MRKGIEIGVGRRIISISHTTHHGRERRAQDEEVQGYLGAGLIQMLDPDHLGCQHRLYFFLCLVEQQVIMQHTGCMDDPIQMP